MGHVGPGIHRIDEVTEDRRSSGPAEAGEIGLQPCLVGFGADGENVRDHRGDPRIGANQLAADQREGADGNA